MFDPPRHKTHSYELLSLSIMTPTSFENRSAPGFDTLNLISSILKSLITNSAIFSANVSTSSNLLFSTKEIMPLVMLL
ncbi:MAG: hypothetical protein CM15mP22_6630 [Gammaproteobacteria bacterium]|nr:MAG: hypothetical protein CM15mP22_6630 [Gammaproteobacteria bacterium]